MFNGNRNQWIIGLIFILTLVSGKGIAPALSSHLDPAAQQTVQEDQARRQAIDRLFQQMQKTQEAQKQAGAKPADGTQTAAPAPIPAIVQRAPIAGGQVQLSYDAADLYEFVNQIADTLGITPIVIDPEVKGSVTIHSSAPMSADDVFPLFNLILKNNNAALVKQGNIYQIVPISSGLKKGLELIEHLPPPSAAKPEPKTEGEKKGDGKDTAAKPPPAGAPVTPPAGAPATPSATPPAPASVTPAQPQAAKAQEATKQNRLSTHVIRVEFIPVKDLIEPVRLFMTDGGVIMPYERLNMLILTDYADSVNRVLEIIKLLDDSYLNPDLVELVKIKNNSSSDVVEDLRKIFGAGTKESATGIYFVSLDRLNAILVMANSKRALEELKRWITQLDATTGRTIQTFVYTVENGTASNIAMILSSLYGGEGNVGMTGSAATGTGMTGGIGSAGRQQSATSGGGFGTPFGSSTTGGGGFGSSYGGGGYGGYGGYGGQGGGFGGGGGGFGSFGGGFVGGGQQLGPRLNQGAGMTSAILRGGAFSGLQDNVRVVVDEINNTLIIQASAPDYAYISETIKKLDVMPRQAIIDAKIFAIDLNDNFSLGITATLQARQAGNHLTTGALTAATSQAPAQLTASTFAFVGDARELLMTLNALREKTKVKVLEAPSVLALDGTEAHIVVGGEYPYPGGSFVGAAGGSTTSVQYRDTGISLIVMPKISASGTVTLGIAQEISSPGATTSVGPSFNKTSVSTTLAVKDGQTVAIAGLIREHNSEGRSGIPFLSDLPLLGGLFGTTTRGASRSEILIMITPHVIRTPEKFQEMTQELRDSLRYTRKFADGAEKTIQEDIDDARRERAKQQEKEQLKQEKSQPKTPEIPPEKK